MVSIICFSVFFFCWAHNEKHSLGWLWIAKKVLASVILIRRSTVIIWNWIQPSCRCAGSQYLASEYSRGVYSGKSDCLVLPKILFFSKTGKYRYELEHKMSKPHEGAQIAKNWDLYSAWIRTPVTPFWLTILMYLICLTYVGSHFELSSRGDNCRFLGTWQWSYKPLKHSTTSARPTIRLHQQQ